MFIGVYLAICGSQYVMIMIISVILILRKVVTQEFRNILMRYSILSLSASLLGLLLFSLVTIPVGNLHFNIPQDFTNPRLLLASLPKIGAILLGLVGVTAPVWTLFFILPKAQSSE